MVENKTSTSKYRNMKSVFLRYAVCLMVIGMCSWTTAADLTVAAGQTYTVTDASFEQFDNAFISGHLIIGAGSTLRILGNFTTSHNTSATVTLKGISVLEVQLSTQLLTGSTLVLNGAARMTVNIFSANGATITMDENSYFEAKDMTTTLSSTAVVMKNGGMTTFRGDINMINGSSLNVTQAGVVELYGNFISQTSTVTFGQDSELRLLGADQKVNAISTFYNLTLGPGKKRLEGFHLYEVQNILNLNAGVLVLDDTLLISNARPESIDRTTGYIDSYRVRRNVDQQSLNEKYLFPLGKGGKYNPVEVTPLAAEIGSYTASLVATAANSLSSVTTKAQSVNSGFFHQIYKTGALTIADVSIFYDEGKEGPFDRILTWSKSLSKWDFLQGGSGSIMSGGLKGIIARGVALSAYNTLNPGNTLFVLGVISHANTTNTTSYPVLKKELDGGFYVTQNGVLRFQFEEEYAVDNSNLTYRVYNAKRTVLFNSSGLKESRGHNFYQLNVNVPELEYGEYAILEVENAKGEKWYLRFTRTF